MTEKIIRFFKAKETAQSQEPGETEEHYRKLIRDNLQYIEAQCVKAIRLQMSKFHPLAKPDMALQLENEAMELSSQVLDKLEASDFKILEQFQGKSKLTTYLTSIISRQAVDMLRRKYGRSRENERAKALGPLGEKVYAIVFQQGLSIVEVQKEFLRRRLPVPTDKAIQEAISKIKGSATTPVDSDDIKRGYLESGNNHQEKSTVIVPDNTSNPETVLLNETKRGDIDKILTDLVGELSGEEQLILRMRFGLGEHDTPQKIPAIASALKISPKTVYKRIDKILKKCRQTLALKGVTIHDLF